MPIKLISQVVRCLHCKYIIEIRKVAEDKAKEIFNVCRKCFIHTCGFGVRTWECCVCAKIQHYEQVELEQDGEYKYVLCPKCDEKINPKGLKPLSAPPKKQTELERFWEILMEWEPKPVESSI